MKFLNPATWLIKWRQILSTALLLALYILCLFQPVDLTVQDLGRHITNGRLIMAGQREILSQNSYSYTMPEQEFINHHWLTGVVFAFIFDQLGINSLIIFQILILTIMFLIFLKILQINSNQLISFALGFIAIIFFATRTEVRPESFAYLAISMVLLQSYVWLKNKKVSHQQFVLLACQQLLWVNLHISFIFSFYILGLNLLALILVTAKKKNNYQQLKLQLILLILSLAAISLINPNFIAGLLEPFNIFKDYGYDIVENKNLFFLLKVAQIKLIYPFLLTVSLQLISFLFICQRKKFQFTVLQIFNLLLAISGIIMAYVAKRNLPIFVLFSFPWWANNLTILVKKIDSKLINRQQIYLGLWIIYLLSVPLFLANILVKGIHYQNRFLGFVPNQFAASQFFKNLNIKGKIFNNYDIGSYLIFELYPDYQVFADNRPEAYSKKFFQETYIPMQENEQIWQKQLAKYQFKAIFFGVRDLTNWGQTFLKNRLADPQWQLVYLDHYAAIFVPTDDS